MLLVKHLAAKLYIKDLKQNNLIYAIEPRSSASKVLDHISVYLYNKKSHNQNNTMYSTELIQVPSNNNLTNVSLCSM